MQFQPIIIFLFITSFTTTAQTALPIFDEAPTWRVSNFSLFAGISLQYIELGPDSSACGQQWNPISLFDSTGIFIETFGYLKLENEKAFVRKTLNCSDPEFLMYDFSLNIGDTAQIGLSPFNSLSKYPATVLNVEEENHLGIERKTITLLYQDDMGSGLIKWVEGIGEAFNHPFYSLVDISGFAEVSFDFHCLETNENLLYVSTNGSGVCELDQYGVRYVNQNVMGGNNDGTSWENAYMDFQDALATVQYGDSIWVAQGVYHPTSDMDRTTSFRIPSGVVVLGGFDGTENTVTERDPETNETILSGNIGSTADSTDNSYHVIYMLGTDTSTVIDGFTITQGNADHPDWASPFRNGGGIYIDVDEDHQYASPRISNCKFVHNNARLRGGAIYCHGENDWAANASIEHCNFAFNHALSQGGGIFKQGLSFPNSIFGIKHCYFEKHFSLDGGGAIGLLDIDNVEILNCTFFENSTQTEGGAIYTRSHHNDFYIKISDCVFKKNIANSGGAITFFSFSPEDSIILNYNVNNSTFHLNRSLANSGAGINVLLSGAPNTSLHINHSNFIGNKSLLPGSAIFYDNSPDNSKTHININSCQFKNNTTTLGIDRSSIYIRSFGGGHDEVYSEIMNSEFLNNTGGVASHLLSGSGTMKTVFTNCSFTGNGDYPFFKNYLEDWSDKENKTYFSNCIIQEYTPIEKLFFNGNQTDYTINDYFVNHSIINNSGCTFNGYDACGEGVLYETDPIFRDTSINLNIANCSPAINAGGNISVDTLSLLTDINGSDRIQEGTVDIGAYETTTFAVTSIMTHPESCEERMDGSISVETNNEASLEYFWIHNSEMGNAPDSLEMGEYFFTIMDEFNCMDTFTVEIDRVVDMEINHTIIDASAFDMADGFIAIGSISGGTPPYSVLWENGDTLFFRANLLPGEYTVTITDAYDCMFEQTFIVSAPSGDLIEKNKTYNLSIFPNPNSGQFNILFETQKPGEFDILIHDILGRQIWKGKEISTGGEQSIPLKLNHLPNGTYFLTIRMDGHQLSNKFVKQE